MKIGLEKTSQVVLLFIPCASLIIEEFSKSCVRKLFPYIIAYRLPKDFVKLWNSWLRKILAIFHCDPISTSEFRWLLEKACIFIYFHLTKELMHMLCQFPSSPICSSEYIHISTLLIGFGRYFPLWALVSRVSTFINLQRFITPWIFTSLKLSGSKVAIVEDRNYIS